MVGGPSHCEESSSSSASIPPPPPPHRLWELGSSDLLALQTELKQAEMQDEFDPEWVESIRAEMKHNEAAALMIQKNYRGYLTRRYISDIMQYHEECAKEEEERIFYEVEKHL